MFYKLIKFSFKCFINYLQFIQVLLVFFSLFIILYWVLQLAGLTFLQPFDLFFTLLKNIIHLFYNRTVQINNISIDFSFLIAVFILLIIAWGIKFIVDFVNYLEKKFDSIYKTFKQKNENQFNIDLEKQYLVHESRNNKFLILINFHAEDLSKDRFYTRDTGTDLREEKQNMILEDFFENLEGNLDCQSKFLNNKFLNDKLLKGNLLLDFNNFDDINSILSDIENIMKALKIKYSKELWKINYLMSVEPYAEQREVPQKTERLKVLNGLGLKDKIICLSAFKQRYSLIKKAKYDFEAQGIYKIKENEEIFCLKSIK